MSKNNSNPPVLPEQKELTPEEIRLLDFEVCWCVEELEKISLKGPKQSDEANAAIKTLKSPNVPVIRKRQIMRKFFGDYKRKVGNSLDKTKTKHVDAKFTESSSSELPWVKKELGLREEPAKPFFFNFPQPEKSEPENKEDAVDEPTYIKIPLSDNSFKFNFNAS